MYVRIESHGGNLGVALRHRERHPTFVDGCFACKALSISVAPSATPSRASQHLFASKEEERRLTTDGEAYKRLRHNGFQPKQINGSAELEAKATTRFEIESGVLYTGEANQGLRDAINWFEDHAERGVHEPATPRPPDEAA